jgi:hypothetical protein
MRERLEIVHSSDFGNFLHAVFNSMRDLITSRIPPQVLDILYMKVSLLTSVYASFKISLLIMMRINADIQY